LRGELRTTLHLILHSVTARAGNRLRVVMIVVDWLALNLTDEYGDLIHCLIHALD